MSATLERMCAFDLETTGLDIENDRIVTAAVIMIDGSRVAERTWLADPGIPIPEEASAIHHVTTDHAREHGAPAHQVVTEIADALHEAIAKCVPIVAFNAAFDLSLLDRECQRHDTASPAHTPGLRVIDPMVLDKALNPYRKGKRRLVDVAAHYRIDLPEQDAHGCNADAMAAARVAWRIHRTQPRVHSRTLDELHAWQIQQAAAQAVDFQAYLRRQGSDRIITPDWPVIPRPTQ